MATLTDNEARLFTDLMAHLAGALPASGHHTYNYYFGAVSAAKAAGWSEQDVIAWYRTTARFRASNPNHPEVTWPQVPNNPNEDPVRTVWGICNSLGASYTPPEWARVTQRHRPSRACKVCGRFAQHMPDDGICVGCPGPPVQTNGNALRPPVPQQCGGCARRSAYVKDGLCPGCRHQDAAPPAPVRVAPPPPPAPPVAEPDIACIDCEVPIPVARLVDGRCKLCIHMANQPPVAEPDSACVECEDPVPSGQLVAGRCKLCIHLANLTAPEPEPATPAPQFTGCEFCLHSLFPSEVAIWRLAHKDDSERRHCYFCRNKCPACKATPIPRGMPTPPNKDLTAGRPQQMDKKGYGVHAGRRQLNGG